MGKKVSGGTLGRAIDAAREVTYALNSSRFVD